MTKESKIKLGMRVQDKISGFIGIATARIECITGCVRFQLSPKAKDNSADIAASSFECDESVLEILDNGLYAPPVKKVPTGAYGRGR